MRIFRWIFLAVVLVATTIAGAAAFTLYEEYWKELPPIDGMREYSPPTATRMYAADGSLVDELFLERRYLVEIEKVPLAVRNAFIASEDAGFYSHRGIDFLGIARAMLANAKAGGVVQGGSTITQQVVKALVLTPERSYQRKIREAMLALRLEQEMSKDKILELYLNQIYFGDGNYGVKAAARAYYDKDLSELTLAEGALLAGLPQAPSRYSPTRNLPAANARKRYVLRRMLDEQFINQGQYHEALRQEIKIRPPADAKKGIRNYYTEHVRLMLEDLVGKDAIYEGGYSVYTAMSPKLQHLAELAVRRGLERLDLELGYRGPLEGPLEAGATPWRELAPEESIEAEVAYRAEILEVGRDQLTLKVGDRKATVSIKGLRWHTKTKERTFKVGQLVAVRTSKQGEPGEAIAAGVEQPLSLFLTQVPELQGALIAIDVESGGLTAMSGGYEFLRSQFNRATQAKRQPGSAFKPFIFAAALDNGLTPASVVYDEPVQYTDNGKTWTPKNYSRRYYGLTRVREALEKSRNVVTVKILDAVGVQRVVDYLDRFQFDANLAPHLSLALGTEEITLLDLVSAYTPFADEGRKITPVEVLRITAADGRRMWADRPSRDDAISPETAALTRSLLEGVIQRGTATRLRALGRPAAGKTGTTNDQKDAWFVGFTPELVVGVWVGFDDHRRSMGRIGTGSHAAAPIWLDFMKMALEGEPVRDFEMPDGIRCVNIDKETGFRADERTTQPFLECFKDGTEPQEYLPYYIWPTEEDPYGVGTPPQDPAAWADPSYAGPRYAPMPPGRADPNARPGESDPRYQPKPDEPPNAIREDPVMRPSRRPRNNFRFYGQEDR